ncbi:MAG: acetate--CoA ligase [Desulfobulbaceae bacterium]|nr:acetate--CoA ligase [Desulfobulbaceae bacterium]
MDQINKQAVTKDRDLPFTEGGSVAQRSCATVTRKTLVRQLTQAAQEDPEQFWAQQAKRLLSCSRPWKSVVEGDFLSTKVSWFPGATLNACYNCIDRHLEDGGKDKIAIIWQAEDESTVEKFSYQSLHDEVCKFANVLKKKGVQKGDCVSLYLPMIPELIVAVLACARIGAVHYVVFSGFSSVSLQSRMRECRSKVLVTADGVNRAGRALPLKANADEALAECKHIESCIVVKRTERLVKMSPGRDSWYHEEMAEPDITPCCDVVQMAADDTLFVLYTSGATGKPKGVAHSTAGYLLYAMYSCDLVFDLQEEDIFWCTADIGWVTGHTYSIYGPLGLGRTSLIFEGIPLFPGPDRYWKIVEKFHVNVIYTAPTVIRALMRFGDQPLEHHDISSLRLLGSVGEPINVEAWNWYYEKIGKKKLNIADTWWQTETGGILITPLLDTPTSKAGSAACPLPGIEALVVDEEGGEAEINRGGRLVIARPWPGMCKEIVGENGWSIPTHGDAKRIGYDTGDGAKKDEDGYFWILGRLDDVINVSGHRLGTAEIESALVAHPRVAEAAVVGFPHALKGQAVYAYVTVSQNVERSEELLEELRSHVREIIGPIASPDSIQYAVGLPKTRSGKIMRRVLKKIAANDFEDFGDVSTLADPSVIDDLIEEKMKYSTG